MSTSVSLDRKQGSKRTDRNEQIKRKRKRERGQRVNKAIWEIRPVISMCALLS